MQQYRIHPITAHVHENLAAADPFYRGSHRGPTVVVREEIHSLDFVKTHRDLGHLEPETLERLLRLRLGDRLPSPGEPGHLDAVAPTRQRRGNPSTH